MRGGNFPQIPIYQPMQIPSSNQIPQPQPHHMMAGNTNGHFGFMQQYGNAINQIPIHQSIMMHK